MREEILKSQLAALEGADREEIDKYEKELDAVVNSQHRLQQRQQVPVVPPPTKKRKWFLGF